jgi:hypothetical protein
MRGKLPTGTLLLHAAYRDRLIDHVPGHRGDQHAQRHLIPCGRTRLTKIPRLLRHAATLALADARNGQPPQHNAATNLGSTSRRSGDLLHTRRLWLMRYECKADLFAAPPAR